MRNVVGVLLTVGLLGQLQAGTGYGICAHVGGHEWGQREKVFGVAKEAGFAFVRADFSWNAIQKNAESWDYSKFDAVVADARENGIKILPILDYSVPFADPAHEHLDLWLKYVSNTVVRYQGDLRCWEVWNEPNLGGFWRHPNPAEYVKLLRPTYELIKRIDPKLTVVVGGFAGVPHEFVEGVYKAGGGKFFDVMNVHPYSQPEPPEVRLEERFAGLREIMVRYGDGAKPIWVTEIGWPTQKQSFAFPGLLKVGAEKIRKDKPVRKIWLVDDPVLDRWRLIPKDWIREEFPTAAIESVSFDFPAALTGPGAPDLLVLPLDESFPVDERLVEYVRNGGIIAALNGFPFYYPRCRDSNGVWRIDSKISGEQWRRKFRISAEASWMRRPYRIPARVFVKGFGNSADCERFFRPSGEMKPGDEFMPLLQGDYEGAGAAALAFNSDFKGGVICCGVRETGVSGNTEEEQALYSVRAILMLRRIGVERTFLYELVAPEALSADQESHFGLVHKDFTAKPGLFALRVLTRAFPADAVVSDRAWRQGTVYYPQWTNPDQTVGGAIWTSGGTKPVLKLTFDRPGVSFTDSKGNSLVAKVHENTVQLPISDSPIYFSGAVLKEVR